MNKTKNIIENPKLTLADYIWRTVTIIVGEVIGLLIIANLNVGLAINSVTTAFIVVISLGIINAIFWPILTRILMPFLVITFGVGTLILNGSLIYLLSIYTAGLTIDGWALVLAPLGMAGISTFLSAILTIEDNSSYYRSVTREAVRRRKSTPKTYPGLIILEIDGLAKDILEEAIEKGHMPTLASWIKRKSHTLTSWETDLSSQTGASQAGILHGNNEDITGFRWVEKENGNKIVESVGFSDAPMIEKRVSNGNGLLVNNGASRSNLFSGDTNNVIFTYSKILDLKRLYNQAWYAVFSNPNNFPRIVFLFFWEMVLEVKSQIMHKIKNIQPRINRGLVYIPTRAGSNVFMREITTQTLIGDMLVGDIDVAYSTYLGYDEIAHHSGIRDDDAWFSLRGIDKQFERLEKGSKYSKRVYNFVIQSDHGQGNGATFKQRYGISFEEYVRSLLPEDMEMFSLMNSNKDHFIGSFQPFKEEISYLQKKYTSILDYVKGYEIEQHSYKKPEDSEVIILASGNLAMIYLTQWVERLDYDEIIGLFPDLIPGLVNHEGVGFIMVNSKNGPIVIGSEGIYYLNEDRVEGKNPLEVFGINAPKHLKRSSSFKYTPDILVNSFYDPKTEEICAFEELVGSHGGIGGTQSKPFILYPSEWKINKEIVGAENIYKILKKELENLKKN